MQQFASSEGANIGLDNQNKQGKDKTNPKINKNKQPYVGNPACKKHSVTKCQSKGRCSNKLVEKKHQISANRMETQGAAPANNVF